ncbi:MAG: hypothetical protein ACOZCL_09290 [Bacillota bacterium]
MQKRADAKKTQKKNRGSHAYRVLILLTIIVLSLGAISIVDSATGKIMMTGDSKKALDFSISEDCYLNIEVAGNRYGIYAEPLVKSALKAAEYIDDIVDDIFKQ